MEIYGNLFFIIFVISSTIVLFFNSIKNILINYKYSNIDTEHVNEESFQNYAKFYGNTIPTDKEFNDRLNIIYKEIVSKKENDIKKIAEISNCTLEECVLKIKYLKNKRLLGDYYVDTSNFKLLPCSVDDQKLLDKYKPYIC